MVAFGLKVPEPPLQVPAVAPPPTVPLRPAVALPEQIVWLPPVLAVAAGWMVIVIELVATPQGPNGSSLNKLTVALPAAISAAVGV